METLYFVLKRPVHSIYCNVASTVMRLLNTLAAGRPDNNRLHNSLLDKCKISALTDLETKSSRILH